MGINGVTCRPAAWSPVMPAALDGAERCTNGDGGLADRQMAVTWWCRAAPAAGGTGGVCGRRRHRRGRRTGGTGGAGGIGGPAATPQAAPGVSAARHQRQSGGTGGVGGVRCRRRRRL